MSGCPDCRYGRDTEETDRLRAELAEAKSKRVIWVCHLERAEKAEAAVARVRELCAEEAMFDSRNPDDEFWGYILYDDVLRALDGGTK